MVLAAASLGALLGVTTTGVMVGGNMAPSSASDTLVEHRPPADTPVPPSQTLLVWMTGALPEGLDGDIGRLPEVGGVTAVRMGLVHLAAWADAGGSQVDEPPGGFVIPLEVMAYDRSTYGEFLPASVRDDFARLGGGGAILGATSARLRGLTSGGRLQFDNGVALTVASVVDDALIGAAEAAVSTETATTLGIHDARYLLVSHDGDRAQVEAAIRALLPPDGAVRIRAPSETPVLRHGDAVLPQVTIKERFGEFAYRPSGDGTFQVDATWEAEHLVSTELPIVGRVRCHRELVAALSGAFSELQERNLAYLVRSDGFAGCWNPRFISGSDAISRHAWGAAVDINAGKNPTGLLSVQDRRLVDVMERWGFTWGGHWLVPDPAHFEYLRPPQ